MIRNIASWLLALALCTFLGCFGCKLLQTKSPQVERFECLVQALEPLVGDVMSAEDLVRDMYAGKANMNALASALRLTAEQIAAYNEAVDACMPPVMPSGEPS